MKYKEANITKKKNLFYVTGNKVKNVYLTLPITWVDREKDVFQ
jgi:hypothetical protein